MLFLKYNVSSQISIEIDSIAIGSISYSVTKLCKEKPMIEGLWDGPRGIFYISIINTSEEFISLDYEQLKFGYLFFFNNTLYHNGLFTFIPPFKRVGLLPEEKISFNFYPSLILDCSIRKEGKYDYSQEMLKIIPTLRVFTFSNDIKKFMFSDKPKEIVLRDGGEREGCYKDDLNKKKFLRKLRTMGERSYELTDHLGNVATVMSDRKLTVSEPPTPPNSVSYYTADIKSYTDYYPFGFPMQGRSSSGNDYRYGFGGQEKDDEIYGEGKSYTAEFWQYDSRLGRRWNIEPLAWKFPWMSYYACFGNNPIIFVDRNGEKIVLAGSTEDRQVMLEHLQKLTNDKLSVRKDGTVIITKMGGENSGKYLKTGSELIRDLNKKGANAKTVTIFIGTGGSGNAASTVDWANATNGIGADATVKFDPTFNPQIPTIDPATGNVSGATRPNEIGLSHELIHADHINKGTVDFTTRTNTYQTATGTQTEEVKKEELNTIGVPGYNSNKATENKIRREQRLNQRGAHTIRMEDFE